MGKGYDAGPCDREAKVWNANGRKTGDVLLVQVVRHGRDFSIDFARLSTNVADSSNDIHCCGSSAVFSEPAFDLEDTAGHSPDEALGKFVAVDADVLRLGTGGVRVATNQPTSTLRLRLVGCLCDKASGWLVGQLQVRLVGWLVVQWPEAYKKVVMQKEVDF
jgi:hypothetical protein